MREAIVFQALETMIQEADNRGKLGSNMFSANMPGIVADYIIDNHAQADQRAQGLRMLYQYATSQQQQRQQFNPYVGQEESNTSYEDYNSSGFDAYETASEPAADEAPEEEENPFKELFGTLQEQFEKEKPNMDQARESGLSSILDRLGDLIQGDKPGKSLEDMTRDRGNVGYLMYLADADIPLARGWFRFR